MTLSDPIDPNQDGYILSFRAELTAAGLTATTDVVVAQGHDGLDAFFDRLVASWRGWQGEQVWEALEHQLSIAASHDAIGHVRLRVTTTLPTPGKPARPSSSTLARTCEAWPAGSPASWRPSASSRTRPSQITQQRPTSTGAAS